MLEPADSSEAKGDHAPGFDLSEKYDTPVFLRTTTRISHAKGVRPPRGAGRPAFLPGFTPTRRKMGDASR